MPKRARKEKETEAAPNTLLIDELDGTAEENANAAYGACLHGIADDNDCVECRSNSCMGGADCECAARSRR